MSLFIYNLHFLFFKGVTYTSYAYLILHGVNAYIQKVFKLYLIILNELITLFRNISVQLTISKYQTPIPRTAWQKRSLSSAPESREYRNCNSFFKNYCNHFIYLSLDIILIWSGTPHWTLIILSHLYLDKNLI